MGIGDNKIEYVVSAPGKVILFGEHSVVYKKSALCTSINKRLYVMLKTSTENKIHISFPQISTELNCNLEQFEKVVKKNCPLQNSTLQSILENPNLINHDEYLESLKNDLETLGVNTFDLKDKVGAALMAFMFAMRGICHSLQCDLVPFSLQVKSELEVGAGTGSSAAFAVAIAGSIFYYRKCLEMNKTLGFQNSSNFSPKQEQDIGVATESPTKIFSNEEIKIINKWAFCMEKLTHGRPSGIDNTTCTFGSVVVTCQNQDHPGELNFNILKNVPEISLLLISTGVSRNTSNLVAKVKQLRDRNCAVVDAIMNAMDVIATEACNTLDSLSVKSLNDTDILELYKTLGGLMELNHGLLRTLGVSHESLENIVDVTSRHGLTSKLTGAGGGGYAITLLPPNMSRGLIETLENELGPTFKVIEVSIAQEGVRFEKL
uniref:Mevalonate kinase n=1 Tax=Homalodisca liturata TaxID=320908 RepID=A0A1B6IB16_9HEMI